MAGHGEPALAVDPRHPGRLLGAAMFLPRPRTPGLRPGAFASRDGGRTWHDFGPLPLPAGDVRGDDVSVAFAGRTGLVAGDASAAGDEGGRVVVWRTTDDGRTFAPPVVVYAAAGRSTDHPSLSVVTAPSGRPVVVIAWQIRGAVLFSRSADDGRTFGPAHRLGSSGGAPATPVTAPGPRGQVSVLYQSGLLTTATNVVTSTDAGAHFGPAYRVPTGAGHAAAGPEFAGTMPAAAADPRTGRLYVALARAPAAHRPRRITLYAGDTAGRTWRRPVTVDPGGHADQFQPALAVDRAGSVHVSYLTYAHGRVTPRLAASVDHAAAFAHPRDLTRPFDPDCGVVGAFKISPWIGDYQALATAPHTVYAAWTDAGTRTTQIAVSRR